jgi:hypothetical protein
VEGSLEHSCSIKFYEVLEYLRNWRMYVSLEIGNGFKILVEEPEGKKTSLMTKLYIEE